MDGTYQINILPYKVYACSSFSSNCIPENILVDNSSDQESRWFTDSPLPQFIILKLTSTALVKLIKFGKYVKSHYSDLKKFQVFGGMYEDNLTLLLTSGLRMNHIPEMFYLRGRTRENLYIPINFIKIVPLESWGPAHNYSIWYVELQGHNQKPLINSVMQFLNLNKEEERVRLLLKHFRRRRYKNAFNALSRDTGVQIEGPLQTQLWNALVESGDYALAENILEQAAEAGEFDWYITWQPYTPEWRELYPCSEQVEGELSCDVKTSPAPRTDPNPTVVTEGGNKTMECDLDLRPAPRGGHQLVVDTNEGNLYLFGGWDGSQDLDDLWVYYAEERRWKCLCRRARDAGGPSPRSCHKMVFDPRRRRLYTLGRYLDAAQRIRGHMQSDLYMYDIELNTWTQLCSDTILVGGPNLVFDHQMCIDSESQIIYVFGGRILANVIMNAAGDALYSGLYAYFINTGNWKMLVPDIHNLHAPKPRVAHSMIYHPIENCLYIFAGQRDKEHIVDMWRWYPARNDGELLCVCACPPLPPAAGFTQRATLDPHTGEIFVLSGMRKEKEKSVSNSLWVLSVKRRAWNCVFRSDVDAQMPRPRCAHQFVYDPQRKVHYLFGGNPGCTLNPRVRLDDMWSLRLRRPALREVVAGARGAVREARYLELAAGPEHDAPLALHCLRTDVHDTLDHSDPAQVLRFKQLATALFAGPPQEEAEETCGAALTKRRARALLRLRTHGPLPSDDMAHVLAVVLGAQEALPTPPAPHELVEGAWSSEPPPSLNELRHDEDWASRAARMRLFDRLAHYFRPSTVHPPGDIVERITLH